MRRVVLCVFALCAGAVILRLSGGLWAGTDVPPPGTSEDGQSGLALKGATVVVAASNCVATEGADFVCDGVDDQEEINAAIARLAEVGGERSGRIQLTHGRYNISEPIRPVAGTHIHGMGVYATELRLVADVNMIECTSSERQLFFGLSDLLMCGDGPPGPRAGGWAVYANRNYWDVHINRCFISNFVSGGIYTGQCWGWVIRDTVIEFCHGPGIRFRAGSHGKVDGCKIMSNTGPAIYASGVAALSVANTMLGTTGDTYAVYLRVCPDAQFIGNQISGGYGIFNRSSRHVTYLGNTWPYCGSPAPALTIWDADAGWDSNNCIVVGNQFGEAFVSDSNGTTEYANNQGYVTQRSAQITIAGDGTTKEFEIAHGLGYLPAGAVRIYQLTPANTQGAELMAGGYWVADKDGTHAIVTFLTAPAEGAAAGFFLHARNQRAP